MKTAIILLTFLLSATTGSWAQILWHNPIQEDEQTHIQNQGWNEDGGNYHRLPNRARNSVRDKVWDLSCQSAGLAIRFKTDARDIHVRYTVSGPFNMPHMPSTGVSGLDLYRCDERNFCFGEYTFGDSIRYHYTVDKEVKSNQEHEYILYLPLYNEVTYLEVGTPAENLFTWVPVRKEKPIVLYGTSIAQGACASRPGMAWGNILSRMCEVPLINLGFSGNGKLESALIELICEQNPALIILDCMPNMLSFDKEEIIRRTKEAVGRIRQQHQCPVLLVEHAGNSNEQTNNYRYESHTKCNDAQKEAFSQLQQEGVEKLFYLSKEELNYHPDAWVDYVHPSDLGMMQQASAIKRKLKEITLSANSSSEAD